MSAPDSSDLDELIEDASIHPVSRTALLRALSGAEVFYAASVTQENGRRQVTVPLTQLADGARAMVVYTSKDHPGLPKRFGGAPFRHALDIAAKIPHNDCLIVTNSTGHQILIDRPEIARLLGDSAAPAGLEALLTRARRDSSKPVADALMDALQEPELYVHLAPSADPGAPPRFVTSRVGEVDMLLLVYTTRRRPGIVYAGMRWSDVVHTVAGNSAIRGVQIVNDADDWVLLHRSDVR